MTIILEENKNLKLLGYPKGSQKNTSKIILICLKNIFMYLLGPMII